MRGLIQRVSHACVRVEDSVVGEIGKGILLLVGIQVDDTDLRCQRLAERVVNYRIFPDGDKKMNLNLQQVNGELLVVSQFTLAADTDRGNRAGFSTAAPPEIAKRLYQSLLKHLSAHKLRIATGEFGADMQVSLLNDGPVTFLLET